MSRLFAPEALVTTDDWYTPAWIFDGLGLTFDVDVAAPEGGPLHTPCRSWLTEADDGLTMPWEGLVWCNPPYSAPTAWCRRWAEHTPGGCLLIRADLSTGGPYAAWRAATSAFVPRKRLQFVNGQGGESGAVYFSTILLGRGDDADRGLLRLGSLGYGAARMLREAHPDHDPGGAG